MTAADTPHHDLVKWLGAQLDRDASVARQAAPWDTGSRHECQPADWVMFLRWAPPGRMLAEAEAKRRMLAACTQNIGYEENGMANQILRLLAAPYAAQPGYRDEWRPTP